MALQNDDAFKKVLKVAQKAFKTLYQKKSYNPSDSIEVDAYKELTAITTGVLQQGISHEVPATLKEYLDKDVFVFSGLKTHAQLTEARSFLKDEKGNIRSYDDFEYLVTKLNESYNRNYLEAEYLFATNSAQSASNWHQFSDDTQRYYLQYRTASDDRVRDSHRVLHNITLPKDDPFWDYYYTPNGWRCRCQVIEVLANKNTKSNSKEAMAKGEKATTIIGKNGKENKLFQFNPGKTKTVFPPDHAYKKVVGAKEVEKELNKQGAIKPLKTTKDVSNYFAEFAEKYPEYFNRGFKEVRLTSQKGVNGFTDMNGTISLKKDILELIKEGINSIQRGEKTTFEQEKALSTMHHEMWHNANKPGNVVRLSTDGTKVMELANEFVARKTLGNFMKKLGGNLENTELMEDRTNTGYNKMVRKYDQLIEFSKADKTKVLEYVKDGLINKRYNELIDVLTKAINKNSIYDIEENHAKAFVIKAINDRLAEADYNKLLENNKKLFKAKGS